MLVAIWIVVSLQPFDATATPSAPTAEHAALLAKLHQLQINDSPNATGYRRDYFPTWLDTDGNGCDARDDVLAAESTIAPERNGCAVKTGRWTSLYDNATITEPNQLDIDHMVPLANAWQSGARDWSSDRRALYANDLSYPDHLIAVTASSNRSKGDRPPNEWRPTNKAAWCRYATAWMTVKLNWSLTATTDERNALGQMLDTCS